MYRPNLKFVASPIPKIIAIGGWMWVANPQSSGRRGHRRSGMIPEVDGLVSQIFHVLSACLVCSGEYPC